VYSDWLNINI